MQNNGGGERWSPEFVPLVFVETAVYYNFFKSLFNARMQKYSFCPSLVYFMVVKNLNIPQFCLRLEKIIDARKALRELPRQPHKNASNA